MISKVSNNIKINFIKLFFSQKIMHLQPPYFLLIFSYSILSNISLASYTSCDYANNSHFSAFFIFFFVPKPSLTCYIFKFTII